MICDYCLINAGTKLVIVEGKGLIVCERCNKELRLCQEIERLRDLIPLPQTIDGVPVSDCNEFYCECGTLTMPYGHYLICVTCGNELDIKDRPVFRREESCYSTPEAAKAAKENSYLDEIKNKEKKSII